MTLQKLTSTIVILFMFIPLAAFCKEEREWRGYLIDRMCMKAVSDSLDPLDFITHHTKDCILMPTCKKQGFSLYLPNQKKWLNLNKKGNELAEALIRKSKRNNAFFVCVKGKMQNNILKVDSIKEVNNRDRK